MRGLLDRWERGVDAFAFSPWSSLVLAVIGVAACAFVFQRFFLSDV